MTYQPILDAIHSSGRSDREVSLTAVGHESAIRSLKRGLDLRGSTIRALCRELGLEFYIGPPRGSVVPLPFDAGDIERRLDDAERLLREIRALLQQQPNSEEPQDN